MRKFVLFIIKVYQKTISFDHGLLRHLYGRRLCRFHPTCSQYTYDAISQFGILRGFFMGLKRFLKCGPWHSGGFDPVNKKEK